MTPAAGLGFALPPGREATAPPERRGVPRDTVRMLVAGGGPVLHRRARDLPDLLQAGDLLVINTSATVPAALDARAAREGVVRVHVSAPLGEGLWVVEPRAPDGAGPHPAARPGWRLELPGDVLLRLALPYPDPDAAASRLWMAVATPPVAAEEHLARHGRPIRYPHLEGELSLADVQTAYATVPGSAEMPSAGRPLTERLITRLVARGVVVAPVVLHAGVSSADAWEPPAPERLVVPAATARLVTATRASGSAVIAVGTTVVRALESAVDRDGSVVPLAGWTDLVLGPDRPARVVDGVLSGLHPPQASHLLLLEAVAGRRRVEQAYAAALAGPYLWHEFGDVMLLRR